MFVLVLGAKGGVGTTTFAFHLAQAVKAVPLDAADGSLALQSGGYGQSLDLSRIVQWTDHLRTRQAEMVARRRRTLLWTPPCGVWSEMVWDFVREVADLAHVVVDGGLAPPEDLAEQGLVDLIFVISAEEEIARWHERRLKGLWPGARVLVGDLKAAAQAIAVEVFGVTEVAPLLRIFQR
jgi:hypothetical protein